MAFTSFGTNRAVLGAQRQYDLFDKDYTQTLAKTASALEINKPSDAPAKFRLAESLQTQLRGYKQTKANSENAIGYMRAMESGLDSVLQNMNRIKTVLIRSMNDVTRDEYSKTVDQDEIQRALTEIDHVFSTTSFASKPIFQQKSLVGQSNNPEFTVVKVGDKTRPTEGEGYNIKVVQYPTRSFLETSTDFNLQERLESPLEITFVAGNQKETFSLAARQGLSQIDQQLNSFFTEKSLPLQARIEDGRLKVEHQEYGRQASFSAFSNIDAFWASSNGQLLVARPGLDMVADVEGERLLGKGNLLIGKQGGKTDGLELLWQKQQQPALEGEENLDGQEQPAVTVEQDPLFFHIYQQQGGYKKFFMPPLGSHELGLNVDNKSGIKSLQEINAQDFQTSGDSLLVLEKSLNDVTELRGKIGIFQRHFLEPAFQNQLMDNELFYAAEGSIKDADMARNLADLTKQKIQASAINNIMRNGHTEQRQYLRLLRF